MNSQLFPNDFILEQYSQIDFSSESFDLFDYFRAINDAETAADLETVCDNLSIYFKGDIVPDVNGMRNPLSSTSMSGTGTSVHNFPEIQPDLQLTNCAISYPVASQYVEPVLYTAPQDYLVSTMAYHESSYIGYPDPPLYSTTWESDVNSCPNSQRYLLIDRMTTEAIDTNASDHLAIQTYQELGNPLPAFDYCYQCTPFSEGTQSTPYPPLGPAVTMPSYPPSGEIFNCSSADVCFCSPTTIPDLSPVSTSSSFSPSSLPAISQTHDTPIPPSRSRSRSSLSPTVSAPAPRSGKRPRSPSTKRPRASTKAAHVLPPAKTIEGPAAKKQRRRSPDHRAAVRCEPWLEEYFPDGGKCTLCGDNGPVRKRDDRALEHLASTHLIQIIKNIKTYDENELADYSPKHLIQTAERFEWTRRYIEMLRCALCVKETSLVYRGRNMQTHLSQVHGNLPERIRLKELKRLYAFQPDRRVWYNFYDKFLYEFFSL